MSRRWQRPDGEVMEEPFRLARQADRLCGENNWWAGPRWTRGAQGAQGQVSEETAKCHDEQCMQVTSLPGFKPCSAHSWRGVA